MTVFSCQPTWEAMLTCIFAAWSSKLGQQNIRLELEPIDQYSLFEEYVHVDSDEAKAESVMDAVNMKISPRVYEELAYVSMSYEKDVLDVIYRVMILGFAYGPNVLEMVQYRPVMRCREIRIGLGKEVCHFQEFSRFHQVNESMYVAHIEPKSRLAVALGPIFLDRMPSENWMIVDDVNYEAIIHPMNQPFYLRKLTEDELVNLKKTEEENDQFADLWKLFFDSIAIKERENYVCQRNHIPLWTRKHAVEFS